MTADPQSLPLAPPPWTCKCTAYVLPWYNSASSGIPIDIAYSPLEANASSFSSEKDAGKYKGGLCMAQVIRYRETPVGEYDELALLPGCFEGPDGKENDLRITGIWVSSKQSLMNGRNNWNIPKHLARFRFTPTNLTSTTAMKIEVFTITDTQFTRPFFTATLHTVSYIPSFPFNSRWVEYLGLPTRILQPPLPEGEPAYVVVGTESWKRSRPVLTSKGAKAVWIDMRQPTGIQRDAGEGQRESDVLLGTQRLGENNWWPGLGRWRLGMWCEEAELVLGEPERCWEIEGHLTRRDSNFHSQTLRSKDVHGVKNT